MAAKFLEEEFLASRFKKRQNWLYKNFDATEKDLQKFGLMKNLKKKFSDSGRFEEIWFWYGESYL